MSVRDQEEKRYERYIMSGLEKYPPYLKSFLMNLGDMLPRSIITYKDTVIKFLKYLEEEQNYNIKNMKIFDQMKPREINEYILSLEGSTAEKTRSFFALKKFFSFLEINGDIRLNPMMKLKSPRLDKPKEAVSLTQEEVRIIVNNIMNPREADPKARDFAIVNREMLKYENLSLLYLGLTAGLRSSSILEMEVQDIDFEKKCVQVVQKGDRYHTAFLGETTIKYLKQWLVDRENILKNLGIQTDVLFIGPHGKKLENRQFNIMLEWASKGIDKKITSHKLRSTCATTIYDNTHDIYRASRVLGHASIETTTRYIKNNDSAERESSEKVDELFSI